MGVASGCGEQEVGVARVGTGCSIDAIHYKRLNSSC